MRIQFVITRGDTSGGAQRHVLDMAEALKRDGVKVQVICGAGSVVPNALAERGVECVSLPFFNRSFGRNPLADLRTLVAMRSAMRAFKPDLVSTHSVKGGMLGRIAARMCAYPCIYTAHGWSVFAQVGRNTRAVGERVEVALARWSRRIIDVSIDGSRFSKELGLPPAKLVTIHNGSRDSDEPLLAVHAARQLVTVTMIGRLDDPKDPDSLIQAISMVPRARLQLVGDGPRQSELGDLARELGCADRVDFMGRRDDIEELLAGADNFCLSSKSEGFPRSVLEAMRAGLPVVVSDVGGSAEAVEEGQTGYVVESGSVEQLFDKLAGLVEDWNLRANLGAAGRARFLEYFTFNRMYETTRALYDEVLGEVAERQ